MIKRWSMRLSVGAILAWAACGVSVRADMATSVLPHWEGFVTPDEGHVFVRSSNQQVGIELHYSPKVTFNRAGSVRITLLPYMKFGRGEPRPAGPFTFDAGASRFGFTLHLT